MLKKYLSKIGNSIEKYPQSIASFIVTGALALPGAYLSMGSLVSDKYDDIDLLSGLTLLSFGAIQGFISELRYKEEKHLNKYIK